MPTVHEFHFDSLDGKPLPLRDFSDRAVLLVNTASRCGFTAQYAGLQALWETHGNAGLVVVGVPSDDFGGQEPGPPSEIRQLCVERFGVTFPMAAKQRVRGPGAHPVYRWMAQAAGFLGRPRWNFHKYLFDRQGAPAGWFTALTAPDSRRLRAAITDVLAR